MLRERRILVPWIASYVIMFALSYVWHGVALNDLHELKTPLTLYLLLSGLVYMIIGLGLTAAMHFCLGQGWIGLKFGFPFKGFLLGAAIGFVVYLIAFIFGMSFTDRNVMHVVVDALWQMAEQGLGGMAVSFGIIYDLHQSFLENERAR